MSEIVPIERIENKIYLIRGQKVILDFHLADLYGVETKQLKRQVKRNIRRFPDDFMFQLTKEEAEILRCQFGASKPPRIGGHNLLPPIRMSWSFRLAISFPRKTDKNRYACWERYAVAPACRQAGQRGAFRRAISVMRDALRKNYCLFFPNYQIKGIRR
jgi:hypothetical protein